MKKLNPIVPFFYTVLLWGFLSLCVGGLVGSVTAGFLISLDAATLYRDQHFFIIYFLPLIGLLIGLGYHYLGGESHKGNNLLISAYNTHHTKIPIVMAPLVFIGTLLTHLTGGSAGREGTAVQMGGAIADKFTSIFKLDNLGRKNLLLMGMSTGFASVFGTPFAGAVFALEVVRNKKINPSTILPVIISAFVAHFICLYWGVRHTTYSIGSLSPITIFSISWSMVAGVLFGLAAFSFCFFTEQWKRLFNKIAYPPFRPLMGGIVLVIAILLLGDTKYIGLGIPTILASFTSPVGHFDFLIKILLTSFTLSAGYKGGEVTPLFFIGATLGNALLLFIPLPMSLLAAMGLVAVFAGATHCVIASIVLGIELFGWEAGLFIGIASIVAHFLSIKKGIYARD